MKRIIPIILTNFFGITMLLAQNPLGNTIINGTLDVNGNTSAHRLTISNSSNAGSNTIAELYRATNTIGSGNQLTWKNNNTSGSQITTGYMHSVLRTNTLGSEMTKWEFRGLVNGSQTEMLEFGDHGFFFKPLGTSIMAIKSDGNVGIGTTTPINRFHLAGLSHDGINFDSKFRLRTSGTSDHFVIEHIADQGNLYLRSFEAGDNSGDLVINDLGGNVGIGTSNPSVKLDVAGYGNFESNSGGGLNAANVSITNSGSGGTFYSRLYLRAEDYNQIIFQSQSGTQDPNQNTFASITGSTGVRSLSFNTSTSGSPTNRMTILSSGEVGIGTTDPKSKLAVNGQIRATEVKVLADITVPDYVFEPDYKLRTLKETKQYITENKHLPEIPSATEIGKNGIDLGDMNMRLLKKIEELTLYQIELMEKLEKQNIELQEVKKEVQSLKE